MASKVKELLNYGLIRGFQQRRVKQLNDFYIEVSLTIESLTALRNELSQATEKKKYVVPKMRGGQRTVSRKPEDVLLHLNQRVTYSEYAQSLVFVVAIAEDYITDIILAILMAYPRKILISAKGNDGARAVDLKAIIEKGDVEAILREEAMSRLNEVMYASPAQYAAYFEKVTGFGLGSHLGEYIELKATRDLLVHNDGTINDIYLGKAGASARGSAGQKIAVDTAYFEHSVRTLKNISSTIYRGLLDKYGDSAEFSQSVRKHLI
jgi:hypothetical protein